MNQKAAKKQRRDTVKQVNLFLDNIWHMPFKDRLIIAWRLVRGKKSK
jgi:hypothetical protein